jgi:filamentous hemagglutinin
MVLEEGTLIGPDSKKVGFEKYVTIDWELVYNPVTKEVWHLQPLKIKK